MENPETPAPGPDQYTITPESRRDLMECLDQLQQEYIRLKAIEAAAEKLVNTTLVSELGYITVNGTYYDELKELI